MGLTRQDGLGMGERKETLSCLALRTRQETQFDSFVKGHTMSGHPTSPVGKRQVLPASPGRATAAPKQRLGVRPSWNLEQIPRSYPRAVLSAQRCSSVLAQAQETATVRGHLPPLRGWLGPEKRGRRPGTYLAQEKPISAPAMLCCCAGARPEASAHISVSAGPPGANQA